MNQSEVLHCNSFICLMDSCLFCYVCGLWMLPTASQHPCLAVILSVSLPWITLCSQTYCLPPSMKQTLVAFCVLRLNLFVRARTPGLGRWGISCNQPFFTMLYYTSQRALVVLRASPYPPRYDHCATAVTRREGAACETSTWAAMPLDTTHCNASTTEITRPILQRLT